MCSQYMAENFPSLLPHCTIGTVSAPGATWIMIFAVLLLLLILQFLNICLILFRRSRSRSRPSVPHSEPAIEMVELSTNSNAAARHRRNFPPLPIPQVPPATRPASGAEDENALGFIEDSWIGKMVKTCEKLAAIREAEASATIDNNTMDGLATKPKEKTKNVHVLATIPEEDEKRMRGRRTDGRVNE